MRDRIPVETMTPEEFNRWYTARCVRVRATRVCVFCGKAIPPSPMVVPVSGKAAYAHYDCTPGLGAPIPPHLYR